MIYFVFAARSDFGMVFLNISSWYFTSLWPLWVFLSNHFNFQTQLVVSLTDVAIMNLKNIDIPVLKY